MAGPRILGALLGGLTLLVLAGAAGPGRADDLAALARVDPVTSRITDTDGVPAGGLGLRLSLSQAVPYRVSLLDGPPRLVVDFREVDFTGLHPADIQATDRIADIHWGPIRPGWSRMVLALDGPYTLYLAEEKADPVAGGARLRVDLAPASAAAFKAAVGVADAADYTLPRPAVVEQPKRRQTGDAPLVVVLDPGHGGIDPGAEAPGRHEAEIVLNFSTELADLLRRAGMTVIQTREADVFVPLETRISVARAAGADVFLSLHADALAEGEAVGATIYKLDMAASDAASAKLAERHDRADLLAGVDLSGQDDMVAGVLMDLARAETQPRADRLAGALSDAIRGAGLKMHRHPVQGANFSVLKSPDIPSLLLELGFLSSERDRARLSDPAWRAKMAQAILVALRAWAVADAAEARLIRQ
jgi:N-acetylmuramoyl-L-alanine amidase